MSSAAHEGVAAHRSAASAIVFVMEASDGLRRKRYQKRKTGAGSLPPPSCPLRRPEPARGRVSYHSKRAPRRMERGAANEGVVATPPATGCPKLGFRVPAAISVQLS